jgi:8-oxo-dGTP pyrophosphatase MutT (NUDIX family)
MSEKLKNRLKKLIEKTAGTARVKREYLRRVEEGKISREENPKTHFCVYFAGYDPKNREIFIGLHKKSGLWLFNGGHLDKGELPEKALVREIKEEWGSKLELGEIFKPQLLTITKIDNPKKQFCKIHYDIWYFIKLNKNHFRPDRVLLAKEFWQISWKTVMEARKFVSDQNTLLAIKKIEKVLGKIQI